MRRERPERGATIVEYALLVALFALGTLAAVEFLQDTAEKKTQQSADAISTRTIPEAPADGGGGGGGGGGGDATTTSTTTSTTSTTSTTVPPTTTTEAPSPQTVNASWTSTSRSTSGTNWRASAELRVRDDLGDPVRGAVVTVRVQTRRGTGSWTNRDTLQATTGSAGSLTFLSGWYPRSGSSRADQVRFTVLSVSAPGLDYVSGSIAVTVDRP